MNEDLFRREFRTVPNPPRRDNLFIWTVGIILLIGVALTCWLGTYYIFGHPEKPDSYHILKDVLHKLEPPKRFELTAAPTGNFLNPQKAFETFGSMSHYELSRKNTELLRDYINNYQSTKNLVPYITGRFSIMSSYELKDSDFMAVGMVALAQAVDNPQVAIEYLYPATPQTLPILEQMLRSGLDIKLEKSLDLSAVINVARTPDGRLLFTVVPLLYGSYSVKQGSGTFSLEPPPVLNPGAGLPVIRGQLYEDALKTYAAYTKKFAPVPSPTAGGVVPVASAVPVTTIVRVDTPSPTPEPSATPAAVAVTTPAPTPTPKAKPTPSPAAVASATPSPSATPALAAASPSASPSASPKTPLKPFLVSAPTPGANVGAGGGNWHTYTPGKMPRGRLVSLSDAKELADRGTGGERLYLHGNFVVSASTDNRAVLRASSSLGNAFSAMTGGPAPRVVVDYPAGSTPPSANKTFSRDDGRPFEITSVRRDSNGQITIFAREVTSD
ncbi:MAG: hypothetical protein ACFUZC_02245 [Chthoniobacteraceae bacterium]